MGGMKDLFGDNLYQLPEPPADKAFNGPDYVPERDHARLSGQVKRVFDLMKDGVWRTLEEIEARTGDPSPSISAQLRHLRKQRFGSHTVEREYLGDGLYRYRLLVNEGA